MQLPCCPDAEPKLQREKETNQAVRVDRKPCIVIGTWQRVARLQWNIYSLGLSTLSEDFVMRFSCCPSQRSILDNATFTILVDGCGIFWMADFRAVKLRLGEEKHF